MEAFEVKSLMESDGILLDVVPKSKFNMYRRDVPEGITQRE